MIRSNFSGLTSPNTGMAGYLDPLAERISTCRKAIVASLLLLMAATPTVSKADSLPDFAVPNGHFYTQANGFPAGTSLKGYAITDEDGIPFWTEFKSFGGIDTLGYPVSRRFTQEGKVFQLTQRVALEYDPRQDRVTTVTFFDLLSEAGRDGWLKESKHIPPPLSTSRTRLVSGTPREPQAFLGLMDQSPQIRQYYESNSKAPALLGLPKSNLYQTDQYAVMRFQKGALQIWKVDTAWARAGDISLVNAGSLLEESGLLPAAHLAPQDPPEGALERAITVSRAQEVRRGLATWYGSDFHGSEMRNGETYDMYDPTITAANVYPLGTWLRVTSVSTGDSVDVRVTDTGAFRHPIIVDLSWAAFGKLADRDEGTIQVTVERIDPR
ncbi:MAG: septal ring lytic transglycosylase RlpA family protein [Chloroflexi bacterium]|nr:septal ring lytic transglycosylase RlpA family protein [Chloroflexota bacterium]